MKLTRLIFVILLPLLVFSGCTVYSPAPTRNSAVADLINQAEADAENGDFARSGTALERALRIEPRNPVLWQMLARVRIDQQQYVQAENLAKKSNALGNGNRSLRRGNWQLISTARQLSGDEAGAREALRRADLE